MDGLIPIFAQTTRSDMSAQEAAFILTIMGIFLVAGFLFYVIPMIFIFKKAGKPGWAVIVPFYNMYVHGQIIGRNPVIVMLLPLGLSVLSFIPLINFLSGFASMFYGALIAYETALVFGQSQGLAIANIFFSPFINFYLAFSSDVEYKGPLYGAPQRILLEAPWLDPALGVQGINPYAPQAYSPTGQYDPNATNTYQPMGYDPTGAGMPGQPPMGTQAGMPPQPPVAAQPGAPTMPPAQPPAAGDTNVTTSASDWGPAPEAPPAAPTGEDDATNPFESN